MNEREKIIAEIRTELQTVRETRRDVSQEFGWTEYGFNDIDDSEYAGYLDGLVDGMAYILTRLSGVAVKPMEGFEAQTQNGIY